jgi:hypothetical protein
MHPTTPALFEKCDHVCIDSNMKINIVDIRNN